MENKTIYYLEYDPGDFDCLFADINDRNEMALAVYQEEVYYEFMRYYNFHGERIEKEFFLKEHIPVYWRHKLHCIKKLINDLIATKDLKLY